MCIHVLKALKFRQKWNLWFRQNGEHHQADMPKWMYPNTRKTVEEDSMDASAIVAMLEASNELFRPVDITLDEDSVTRSASLGSCHGFATPTTDRDGATTDQRDTGPTHLAEGEAGDTTQEAGQDGAARGPDDFPGPLDRELSWKAH